MLGIELLNKTITKDKIELRLFERKLVGWRNPDETLIGGIQGEEWELAEFDAEPKTDTKVELKETISKPPVKEEPQIIPKKEAIVPTVKVDNEITQKVLDTAVEHTGYPEDFIEFDQDLEGELGVDSVKQAEIMADLRAHFVRPRTRIHTNGRIGTRCGWRWRWRCWRR